MRSENVGGGSVTPASYTLFVQKSGAGSGTVSGGAIDCGSTCSASIPSGSVVSLTATPDAASAGRRGTPDASPTVIPGTGRELMRQAASRVEEPQAVRRGRRSVVTPSDPHASLPNDIETPEGGLKKTTLPRAWLIPWLALAAACSIPANDHSIYRPLTLPDWEVSTPEAEGVNPDLVFSTYQNAGAHQTLYSLLIVKNDRLIAEGYFNHHDYRGAYNMASATKSFISSLAGIALKEGVLPGLEQTMAGYFPEIHWPEIDPRKAQITIRQILEMRSGFPWEEMSGHLDALLATGIWIPFIEQFPLSADPGTRFGYSNLTAHLMAIILARAANTDLRSWAKPRLFDPLGIEIGNWNRDPSGYYYGTSELFLTPRAMAKFGLLYLEGGKLNDHQIVPADWVADSLTPYSFDAYGAAISKPGQGKILASFDLLDYGYLWWSSKCGRHPIKWAWGHGGNLIVLVPDLHMVLVTSADNLPGVSGEASWTKESAIMEMVGEFISAID